LEEEELNKEQKSGYIYVLSNPSMPGVLKIGKTTRDVTARAMELQSTGLPTPFEIEFSIHVNDCHSLEKLVHNSLATDRVSNNREFFNTTIEEVKGEIVHHAGDDFTNADVFFDIYQNEIEKLDKERASDVTRLNVRKNDEIIDVRESFGREFLSLRQEHKEEKTKAIVMGTVFGGLIVAIIIFVFFK